MILREHGATLARRRDVAIKAFEKAALFFWGAACLPLVGIGLLGAMLPAWLRHKPHPVPLS